MAENKVGLSKSWYYFEPPAPGVQTQLPGIYEWIIQTKEGPCSYIGKYTSFKRPTYEYGNNVRKLLSGERYRLNNENGYRNIHHALADAVREGRAITLRILENSTAAHLNEREQSLIRIRRASGCLLLNGSKLK